MNVTIEIPDDRIACFQKKAEALGLTVDEWLLQLAEQSTPQISGRTDSKRTFAEVCASVRGFADDLDFSRDPSPGRDFAL